MQLTKVMSKEWLWLVGKIIFEWEGIYWYRKFRILPEDDHICDSLINCNYLGFGTNVMDLFKIASSGTQKK
jgi:hypothetical protein